MSTGFAIGAALSISIALALMLRPWIAGATRLSPSLRSRALLLPAALAFSVGAGAIALYLATGAPRALDPTARVAAPVAEAVSDGDLEAAIAGLRTRMAAEPDDPRGWFLLGQGLSALDRHAEARDAYARAHALAPEDPTTMVEYAETMTLAAPDRALGTEARALLARAVAIDPTHQRGLWLLGVAEIQSGNEVAAIAAWQQLEPLLEPGSPVAAAVRAQIDQARARSGIAAPGAASASATRPPNDAPPASALGEDPAQATATAPDERASVKLDVVVDIAADLAAKVKPGSVLFVFARPVTGPRMPVAIARIASPVFPVAVALDDSSAMIPGMTLSSQSQVIVGARISASGSANAASGDIEDLSEPIVPATRPNPVALTLNRVVP